MVYDFTMTDETYAVNCNLEDQDKEQVMFYVALFFKVLLAYLESV